MAKVKQVLKTGHINELVFDDKNANAGTEAGNGLVADSIGNLGLGRSVLVDKNNKLIAGNKTMQQATALNFDECLIVETTGEQLVVVRRMDLDLDDENDPRGRALALADNRAAAVNLKWNPENMKIHFDAAMSLSMPDMVFELDIKSETSGGGGESKDQSDKIGKMFKIELDFADEAEQAAAFDALTEQGYQCKILTL